jgi:cytochrome d ubiquinol oxidase subunit I
VPLVLFAIPDEEARDEPLRDRHPGLASLILTHEWDGELPGLNDFVAEDGTVLHPPVAPVFWSFRIMVGTGVAMLLVLDAVFFMWRRMHLHEGRIAGHWFAVEGLPKPLSGRWCRWPSRAGSPRLPAGTRPRSAVSPGWCRA